MAKRKDFSLSEKYDLIQKYNVLPKCNQREASLKLGITQSSLCRLLKQKNKILEDHASNANTSRKRQRVGKAEDVEAALLQWFNTARLINAPLSRAILCLKAEEFSEKFGMENFTATEGWLTRWKKRHNIVYKKQYGEKADANISAAHKWLQDILPGLLSGYSAHQIYNMDETALFYRALPEHTIMFKNESRSGCKKIKARITVLLTCNMTGNVKKIPLVIGNSKNPRCLKGVKKLPIEYSNNTKAWMTSEIFKNYMKKWDQEIGPEKIAVLLDNCTAHPKLQLNNIELFYLPPNTTSVIQPLNQGIIKTFKTYYRKNIRMKIIEAIDDPAKPTASDIARSISLLDAFHMLVNAWRNVTPITIFNCFRKSGFYRPKKSNETSNIPQEEDPCRNDEELDEAFWNWVDIDENVQTAAEQTEEDIVLSIQKSKETTEDADEEEVENYVLPPPTAYESRQALQILRRTLEQRGASCNDYDSFYDIENRVSRLISATSQSQMFVQ